MGAAGQDSAPPPLSRLGHRGPHQRVVLAPTSRWGLPKPRPGVVKAPIWSSPDELGPKFSHTEVSRCVLEWPGCLGSSREFWGLLGGVQDSVRAVRDQAGHPGQHMSASRSKWGHMPVWDLVGAVRNPSGHPGRHMLASQLKWGHMPAQIQPCLEFCTHFFPSIHKMHFIDKA